MNLVFADTSGWLAIVIKSDSLREKAVKVYLELLADGCNFVTHEAVILEVGNGLSNIKTRDIAVKLKESVEESSRIESVSLSPELVKAGWKLYAERADKNWGIVDCISFIVMQRYGIVEASTADRHFEQAGFIKLL